MLSLVIQNAVAGSAIGLLYGLIGLGVVLFFQTTNLMNFAHISSAMLGAYLCYTYTVMWKLPFALAIVMAVMSVALYGLLLKRFVYAPLAKRKGGRLEFIIATLMLSVFLLNAVIVVWGGVPLPFQGLFGSDRFPIFLGNVVIQYHSLFVLAYITVFVIALQYFFTRTMTGKSLRAVAQNPRAARLMGINVDRMLNLSFMLSTGVTALAGILLIPVYFVSLDLGSGIIGVKGFACAVMGGMKRPYQALLGGVLIGLAENFVVLFVSSTYRDVITFLFLIIFLVLRKQAEA
ncbi:MAG: High-affinity branched-chain amino acid transport system permease protein LivH [Firmicutes bacterium ADurb.Bin506]|nr:MAG: High-affinity branched-chain amino acid transport system permease protein LivH [Firmicutes bacterium ADurb.Bin506]